MAVHRRGKEGGKPGGVWSIARSLACFRPFVCSVVVAIAPRELCLSLAKCVYAFSVCLAKQPKALVSQFRVCDYAEHSRKFIDDPRRMRLIEKVFDNILTPINAPTFFGQCSSKRRTLTDVCFPRK